MTKIQYRNNFLSLTCIGFCVATVYSLIQPTVGNRQVSSFSFPESIPLQSWQLVKTESILNSQPERKKQEELIASGKSYTYSNDRLSLEIEMLYLVGTRGNVHGVLENQIAIPAKVLKKAETQKLENVGFYTIFSDRHRAYLSSCINSRGNTTVTQKQFSQNRYAHDLKYSLLLPWLFGQETIRDRRCLLTNLSIPVENLDPEVAYEILQSAWQDWYSWWQPKFPNL